jgi:hypothetical protein
MRNGTTACQISTNDETSYSSESNTYITTPALTIFFGVQWHFIFITDAFQFCGPQYPHCVYEESGSIAKSSPATVVAPALDNGILGYKN